MLLGREREQEEIDRVLRQARSGASATLALVGEAGIGKTVLLDYGARRATDMRILRARGIESEAQIPFASLLELTSQQHRPCIAPHCPCRTISTKTRCPPDASARTADLASPEIYRGGTS